MHVLEEYVCMQSYLLLCVHTGRLTCGQVAWRMCIKGWMVKRGMVGTCCRPVQQFEWHMSSIGIVSCIGQQ